MSPTSPSNDVAFSAGSWSQSQKNQEEEVYIAVMGATGSGKTTFINTVSGSKMRTSSGLRSCTNVVEVAPPFSLDGKSVTLIDTPGFDDTTRSDTEILRMIAIFLSSTYQNGKKLSGVIYIHRISDFRVGGQSTRNFRMFRELCGDSSLRNVVILTNMWEQVTAARGEARERELAEDDTFFRPVLAKGAKMLRLDQTLESARTVVRYLLGKPPMILQIQRELVDEGKDILQTAAGKELNKELIAQMDRQKKEMAELQRELQAALDSKDEEGRLELEEATKKLQAEMTRVEHDSKTLAPNFRRERNDFERRLRDAEAEARRETARLNEHYQSRIDYLERQRRVNANLSEEAARRLQREIAELEAARREQGLGNGSELLKLGVMGLNMVLLAVYPPVARTVMPLATQAMGLIVNLPGLRRNH